MCVYTVFVAFCVWVAALRLADPPFKGPYRLKKEVRALQRDVELLLLMMMGVLKGK
jgi:hypothetical protein